MRRHLLIVLGIVFCAAGASAQEPAQEVPLAKPISSGAVAVPPAPGPDKRAYGVLPNYRTAELGPVYTPITVKQKFTIARQDSLDWPSYMTALMFAGISQVSNDNPSFGQGTAGFAKRYGTAAVDQIAGNFMTEAILPTLFHQDPRYFRRGHGSPVVRIAYALSRSAIAKNDKGNWTFNAAEFLGNGMVAAAGNAYYKDSVGLAPTLDRMSSQILTDSISQCLKEYWPDVKAMMQRMKARKEAAKAAKSTQPGM